MRLLPVISGIKCAMFIIEDLALLATDCLRERDLRTSYQGVISCFSLVMEYSSFASAKHRFYFCPETPPSYLLRYAPGDIPAAAWNTAQKYSGVLKPHSNATFFTGKAVFLR